MDKPIRFVCSDSSYSQTTKLLEYQVYDSVKDVIVANSKIYSETLWLNNIGEWFALIKSIYYVVNNDIDYPIYVDSNVALNWVNKGVSTTIQNEKILNLIKSGENYLQYVKDYVGLPEILKWRTKADEFGEGWGEIPADFNRKGYKKQL